MGLARADDVIGGIGLLEDKPHGFDVVGGIAPVSAGVDIAGIEAFGPAGKDGGQAAGDLAGDKRFAPAGGFVKFIEVS